MRIEHPSVRAAFSAGVIASLLHSIASQVEPIAPLGCVPTSPSVKANQVLTPGFY